MIAFNSSFDKSGFSSTSIPLARKISAAFGSIVSEISTLGIAPPSSSRRRPGSHRVKNSERSRAEVPAFAGMTGVHRLVKGPVEPGSERLDVLRLDGGAAPDAQARRRRP